MTKEEIGVFRCSRLTQRQKISASQLLMQKLELTRRKTKEKSTSWALMNMMEMKAGKTMILTSGRQGTSKERGAIRRKNLKLTLNLEITKILQVKDLLITTTAVYTITQLMKIAKKPVEEEKPAGWKTECHRTIQAIT
jgi:hypothetical protein